MLEIILPDTADVITKAIKLDSGYDVKLKLESTTAQYQIFVNTVSGSRYLVQTSTKFDILGFYAMSQDFPKADVYIFMDGLFIGVFIGEDLHKDFLMSGEWTTGFAPKGETYHRWTSAFQLFHRIGGFIYNYKAWILVDKK